MICKSWLFIGALLGYSLHGVDSVDKQIQTLKEKRRQICCKLEVLNTKILKKQRLKIETYNSVREYFRDLIESKHLKGEEYDDFVNKICKQYNDFSAALTHLIKSRGNVKGFLMVELFSDLVDPDDPFNVFKFWVIWSELEAIFLKELVEQYEGYLQQMIDIDYEIEVMQNQN